MPRPRIRDIAEAAGVSPATVSRYLNNRPGQMSDETRERIAQVIERTGYRPRSAARNLRRERSGLIGVVMADVSNPYSSAMLEALAQHADEHGYALMTAFSGGDAAREGTALDRLVDAGVDALVVNACENDDAAIEAAARRVPTVLLDRPVASGGIDLVTSNNDELMDALVDELARSGCTGADLLTEAAAQSAVRRRRAEAFRRACAARGIDAGTVALSGDAARDRAALDALTGAAQAAPRGVVAVNGLVLLRLIEALAPAGGALPAGLRVASFDDYPWNRVLFGGITTAVQDTDAIAAAVIDRVMLRVERSTRAVGEHARLDATVIEVPGSVAYRASTCPRA